MIELVKLNRVKYSVRASQAVLQYGVGAMIDFPDQTLITSAPEFWSDTIKIYDDRFTNAIGVEYLAMPSSISYVRFPEWYFCPKCRRFQPISSWVKEYREKAGKRKLELDFYMVQNMQCLKCYQDLVVTRIVTICEHGHINDFPWVKWVHKKSKKRICALPSLKFKTGASSSEGLDGLSVSCSCGAYATLKGAFDKGIFEKFDKENGTSDFCCEGNHPQRNIKEKCALYPKTVQRGSSSVYFPLVYSSLVIPPYADKLNLKIEKSQTFSKCMIIIEDEDPNDRIDKIKNRISKWAEIMALEIGEYKSDIERILRLKWLDKRSSGIEVNSVKYKADEYISLNGDIYTRPSALGDFCREGMDIDDYKIPNIKSISLIDKVRIVKALVGFSRVNPVINKLDRGFVPIKKPETRWYPAYEVRGEGIFIEFDQNKINDWVLRNHTLIERARIIQKNYNASFSGRNHSRTITPKFIMLHTLSHLLIKQLSFECGYSIASLCERIYCAEESDGKQMAGIFIYTASGDSEGTLGGLVRQGRSDVFPHIFRKAIASAKTCSNDPVCMLSRGQGRSALNLAACHACSLLPETSCEEGNAFLDRGLLVGTFESKEMGFFSDLV